MNQEKFDVIMQDPRNYITPRIWSIGLKTPFGWRWTVRHLADALGVTTSLIKHRIKASGLEADKRYWVIRGQEAIAHARALAFPMGSVPTRTQSVYMLSAHACAWVCESVRERGSRRPPSTASQEVPGEVIVSAVNPAARVDVSGSLRGAFRGEPHERSSIAEASEVPCDPLTESAPASTIDHEIEVEPGPGTDEATSSTAFAEVLKAAAEYRAAKLAVESAEAASLTALVRFREARQICQALVNDAAGVESGAPL